MIEKLKKKLVWKMFGKLPSFLDEANNGLPDICRAIVLESSDLIEKVVQEPRLLVNNQFLDGDQIVNFGLIISLGGSSIQQLYNLILR